jgi:selenium-binding protein 1
VWFGGLVLEPELLRAEIGAELGQLLKAYGGCPGKPTSRSGSGPHVGPHMMRLTGDGKRMYISNSLLSTLDHSGRFYVRLIHIPVSGMQVDPFFNIDLNKFPTGPARGHDMRIN